MKKIAHRTLLTLSVCIALFSLTSCGSTYKFCQVYETKPMNANEIIKTNTGGQKYEDNHCIITYYFWSNYGSASFDVYNKSDEIIYIDLAKSFFIRNGVAYDLYKAREWSESNTSGYSEGYGYSSTYSTNHSASIYGFLTPTINGLGVEYTNVSIGKSASQSSKYSKQVTHIASHSSAVSFKEQQIIAIPPHSQKAITTYTIVTSPILSCDLQRYPERNSRMTYTQDNSPVIFTNYITYSVGKDNTTHAIENSFYVSAITNYAEPDIIEYKKRSEPCENLKDNPEYATHNRRGRLLYDKTMKSNICEFPSSFYLMYETTSSKRLYKVSFLTTYWYDPEFHAYTVGSNGNY